MAYRAPAPEHDDLAVELRQLLEHAGPPGAAVADHPADELRIDRLEAPFGQIRHAGRLRKLSA